MVATQLTPILFGITTAIAWGMADFFAAKASKRASPESTLLWVSIIGVLLFATIFLVHPGTQPWTHEGALFAALAGIFLELGMYTFYKGLAIGPVSIVSPISSAYPLITTVVLVFVFHTSLQTIDIVGIVVVVLGVTLASNIHPFQKTNKRVAGGISNAILTIFLWGLAYSFLAQAVSAIGWEKSTLIDTSVGLLSFVTILACTARKKLVAGFNITYLKNKYIIGAALMQVIGGMLFTIGLSQSTSGAVITAVSAIYPVLVVFLALRYFKEKRRPIPLIGAFVTIIGVVILSAH